MEDAHTHLLSLSEDKDAAFFAVYDGHGGAKVAQYAGSHVHRKIVSQPSYQRGDVVDAIKKGFLEVDSDMLKDDTMKDELAGTTAVVVLLKGGRIYCGNVGDSRAIASVGGHVQQLSFDHKPSNELETRRIIAAGGWVEFNRVNGNLALSRALGDFVFKKNEKKSPEEQIVTAYPDVIVKDLTPEHEFLLLACDGIWDVLSNEEVVEFVRARIAAKMEPEQICEELMTRCLAPDCQMGGLGCDNMTVVLVCLLNGAPYEELARRCARPPLPCPPSPPASPREGYHFDHEVTAPIGGELQMDAHRQGDTAEESKQMSQEQTMTPEEQTTPVPPSPPTPPSSSAPLRESGGEMAVA
uniref:protein-serine/threonine phosphatase n=1 Tax=Amblyomma cajennense TaxID=34607 RepID=A0A023FQF5_AMBCJ